MKDEIHKLTIAVGITSLTAHGAMEPVEQVPETRLNEKISSIYVDRVLRDDSALFSRLKDTISPTFYTVVGLDASAFNY